MLGIRPQFDCLEIDPCIPAEWDGFEVQRVFRGVKYTITVENPKHVMTGVKEIYLDENPMAPVFTDSGLLKEGDTSGQTAKRSAARIPFTADQEEHKVRIIMGVMEVMEERKAQL